MKKLLNVIVLAAMVAGAYYGLEFFRKQKADEAKPEIIRPVKTVTLGKGEGGVWRYYGTLQGGKRVELSFRVSGPLKQILVDKGASVKKNDLLATLDPRDFQTQLKQAQSNQAQAQAQYNDAQTNFKRYENLYKQKAVSKSQYDTQKTQVDVARSALNAAAAQTAAIRDSLKDTELRAPFDGVIADRMVENFQDVTAKQPIFSLQDLATLDIVFNVPDSDVIWASQVQAANEEAEKEARKAPNGDHFTIQARFDAMPERVFPLKIKEFVLQADPNTNTFPLTATMPQQKDVALLPGMAATVEIIPKNMKETGSAFIVPATALIHESKSQGKGANFVWLYKAAFGEETGEVRRVAVNTGMPRNDGSVEISGAALTNGDRVVTAGAHLLKEGQKVRLMDNQQ